MHSYFAKSLDRFVIALACRHSPRPGSHPPCASEAAALLERADFFAPAAGAPADFKFDRDGRFTFISSVKTPWPENNLVYGRLWRAKNSRATNPAVILIHGWNDEMGYRFRFPFLARRFARLGINSLAIELPYHLQRRPRAPGAVRDFISEDLRCMIEATQQAMVDIRAALLWLKANDCPAIGLWGFSLGAWLGALLGAHDSEAKAMVVSTPPVNIRQVIDEVDFCAPVRRSLNGTSLSLERLDLLRHQPRIARENILIIEAAHDQFTRAESVEALWRAWGEPEIWRVPHGHISLLCSMPAMIRTTNWLAKKLLPLPAEPHLIG